MFYFAQSSNSKAMGSPFTFAVRVRQVSISEEQFEAFMEAARAGLMGISMGGFVAFHWDFMGFYGVSCGFYGDLMAVFYRI